MLSSMSLSLSSSSRLLYCSTILPLEMLPVSVLFSPVLRRIFSCSSHSSAGSRFGAVVSARLDNCDPQEAAMILDGSFGIAVRSGLHCAPYAHRTIGTLESGGTIRFSPDLFNTPEEIDRLAEALARLVG